MRQTGSNSGTLFYIEEMQYLINKFRYRSPIHKKWATQQKGLIRNERILQ